MAGAQKGQEVEDKFTRGLYATPNVLVGGVRLGLRSVDYTVLCYGFIGLWLILFINLAARSWKEY